MQGVGCRGGPPQKEDAVTLSGDSGETMVTGGGRGRSSLHSSLMADGAQSQDCCSVRLAALAWLTIP